MKPSVWRCLEDLPGLIALPHVWQKRTGQKFAAFTNLCLQSASDLATVFPCPNHCGCAHSIILRHDRQGAVAICRCTPEACPDIPLTIPEITPLQVNHTRLGRAICNAFSLDKKQATFPIARTTQIGSWSADAVPVIFTIQNEYDQLRTVIAELGMRLKRPFILIAPTSHLLTATCHELLADAHAGFFPLDAHVTLTDHGTLYPCQSPGQIFTNFTPQPKELDEDVARRAFALVNTLDSDRSLKRPTIVFRMYCTEERSAAEIASACKCSKATIISRLNLIRQKTGANPIDLRRLSSHLNKIEADLSDPRAAHIHRKRLINDED